MGEVHSSTNIMTLMEGKSSVIMMDDISKNPRRFAVLWITKQEGNDSFPGPCPECGQRKNPTLIIGFRKDGLYYIRRPY